MERRIARRKKQMSILSLSQIIKKVVEAEHRRDKVAILQYYQSPQLKALLKYHFDPNIKFRVSKDIKYKPNDDDALQGRLYYEMRTINTLVGNTSMKQEKIDKLFVQILETIDKDDAELLMTVKDKKTIKGLTEKAVREAFKDLL